MVNEMTTGDHFCTFGILFDINSDAKVVAKTYCEVLKLMREDLDEVLSNHRSLSKYGVSRLVSWASAGIGKRSGGGGQLQSYKVFCALVVQESRIKNQYNIKCFVHW